MTSKRPLAILFATALAGCTMQEAPSPARAAPEANAQAAFPDALPRRLMLPRRPGAPAVLRLRQSFEWTPNGRTYVYLDPATARVMAVEDPAAGDTARRAASRPISINAFVTSNSAVSPAFRRSASRTARRR